MTKLITSGISRRTLLKATGGLIGAAALPMPFIRRANAAGA